MTTEKDDLQEITVNNKGYGNLDGTKIYITKALYNKLESKKSRSGQNFVSLLMMGRAIRGFKHLLESIKSKEKSARLILTDQATRRIDNDYYINLDEYSKTGQGKFLAFYRKIALDVSSAYLSNKFPNYFESQSTSLSSEEITKTGKHFDQVLDELTQKRKHKKQLLRKTSKVVQNLQSEKQSLKKTIVELEELKRQSSIAFYVEKVEEFKERLEKNHKETTGKSSWQSWLYKNNWIIGIQYLRPIEKRRVGFDSIPDFLFPTLDGFIDILEIKLPSHDVIRQDSNHPGSYAWSSDANKAIGQVVNYLYEMELHQLELQTDINRAYSIELGREITVIKPRAFIMIGREDEWDANKKEAFRKLNHTLHGIEVITYTDILKRGEYIINLFSKPVDIVDNVIESKKTRKKNNR